MIVETHVFRICFASKRVLPCLWSWLIKLQRVMNSAARIITNTRRFDHHLTHVRHDILHWLDVPERVTFKLCLSVYKCLHGMGRPCVSVGDVPADLVCGWSSSFAFSCRGHLAVPRYRLTTAGRRAFSFAGPSAQNSLPAYLKNEMLTLDSFKRYLKCFLFDSY